MFGDFDSAFTRGSSHCALGRREKKVRLGRRTCSNGCMVHLEFEKPAPSIPANGEGGDIVSLFPEEQGRGRGASAGVGIGAECEVEE